MKNALDATYPLGDPDSTTCRHCKRLRQRVGGVLFCTTCDGPSPAHAMRHHGPPPT